MSGVSFTLSLVDKLSGPVTRATAAVTGLAGKARQLSGPAGAAAASTERLAGKATTAASSSTGLAKATDDAAGKVARVAEASEEASGEVSKLAEASDGAAGGVSKLGGSARGMGGAGAAVAKLAGGFLLLAAAVTSAVAVIAGKFAKAVLGAAMFGQKTELAFGALLKDSKLGAAQFERLQMMTVELGLDLESTTKGFSKLLTMGFGTKQAEDLIRMGADMQKIGASAEEVERSLLALSQIKATGYLQGDELMQLAEAGVPTAKVFEILAKKSNKTVAEMMKLKEAGKITADMAIDAVGEAIKATAGISNFGDAGKKFADSTLEGMWKRLKALGGVVMQRFGKAALGPLMKLAGQFSFDPEKLLNSPRMRAAVYLIGAAATWLGDKFTELRPQIMGLVNGLMMGFGMAYFIVKPAIQGIADQLSKLRPDTMRALAATGMLVVGAMVAVAVGVGLAVLLFLRLTQAIADAVVAFGRWIGVIDKPSIDSGGAVKAGANMAQGFIDGMRSKQSGVSGAAAGLAKTAHAGFTAADDQHSPSRKFMGFAVNSVDGLIGGYASRLSAVEGASAGLAVAAQDAFQANSSPTDFEPALPGRAGGAGGATVTVGNIEITITAADNPRDTAQEVKVMLERELARLLGGTSGELAPA